MTRSLIEERSLKTALIQCQSLQARIVNYKVLSKVKISVWSDGWWWNHIGDVEGQIYSPNIGIKGRAYCDPLGDCNELTYRPVPEKK